MTVSKRTSALSAKNIISCVTVDLPLIAYLLRITSATEPFETTSRLTSFETSSNFISISASTSQLSHSDGKSSAMMKVLRLYPSPQISRSARLSTKEEIVPLSANLTDANGVSRVLSSRLNTLFSSGLPSTSLRVMLENAGTVTPPTMSFLLPLTSV